MFLSRQQIYLIPYQLTEEIVLFFVLVVQVYYKKVKGVLIECGSEIIGKAKLVGVAIRQKIQDATEKVVKEVKIITKKVANIFNVARFNSFKFFVAFVSEVTANKIKILSIIFSKNKKYTPDFVIYSNLLAPPLL